MLFLFKNKSSLTSLGAKFVRLGFIWLPASLKSLSAGTDVTGIDKYFLDIFESIGNSFFLVFHQTQWFSDGCAEGD